MSAILRVEHISHRYGERAVLQDVNFEVDAGEVLAIMGSSGGGKSTLLKIIAGLLVPSEGDVWVNGVSAVQQPDEVRRHLGLVFQSAALFDYLSVYENVAFGLRRMVRQPESKHREQVAEVLADVGLAGTEQLMPDELSGGMKKRVGLARALILKPEVLLYDEPTSGLDPVTAYAIDELIAETSRRLGVTSVVVSHDVSSVFRVAEKIAFLSEGELRFFGGQGDFRQSQEAGIRDLVEKARSEVFLNH